MAAKLVNLMMGVEVAFEGEASIGRAPGNTIVIPRDEVSKAHAKITWDEAALAYVLEDLGSRNGTWLDGVRIKQPERLGKQSVLTIAGVIELMFFEIEQAAAASPLPPEPEPEREPEPVPTGGTDLENVVVSLPAALSRVVAPADAKATAADSVALPLPPGLKPGPSAPRDERDTTPDLAPPAVLPVFGRPGAPVDGDATGELPALPALALEVYTNPPTRYALAPGENLVGKGDKATILVRWIDVSRLHAAIVVETTRVVLKDLGSTYGTLHEGRRVDGAVEIRAGDSVQFGSVKARLVAATPVAR